MQPTGPVGRHGPFARRDPRQERRGAPGALAAGPTPGYCAVYDCGPGASAAQYPMLTLSGRSLLVFEEGSIKNTGHPDSNSGNPQQGNEEVADEEVEKELEDGASEEIERQCGLEEAGAERGRGTRKGRRQWRPQGRQKEESPGESGRESGIEGRSGPASRKGYQGFRQSSHKKPQAKDQERPPPCSASSSSSSNSFDSDSDGGEGPSQGGR